MRYAQHTTVSVEKSEIEIRRLLQKYGASQFASGWDQQAAYVGFTITDRRVRFTLTLPAKDERRFLVNGRGMRRSPDLQLREWEQACRQSWRALVLVLKAKLEAVEAKITTFEQEFLPHIVLPNGRTIAEQLLPQLDALIAGRRLLTAPSSNRDDTLDGEVS